MTRGITNMATEEESLGNVKRELEKVFDLALRAALEGAEEVKAKVEENVDSVKPDTMSKEAPANESELVKVHGELEIDSDNDTVKTSKIEPTIDSAFNFE